jgi:AraC family transcriptional regulator
VNTEAIILYLSQNFREKIQLADLARQINLSKFHFHRLFTAEIGITPQQYLEKMRIEHAAHFLMLNRHAPLQEVAFESGYSSPACFSRSFKNRYKISASEFRNLYPEADTQTTSVLPKPIVQYLSSQKIYVNQANLHTINEAYQEFRNQHPTISMATGFYIDAPFHIPTKECRHYIGSEQASHLQHSISIPAGYYTSLKVKGPFDTLRSSVIELKTAIEASGYIFDTLVGFERITLPVQPALFDYFSAERELYLKIKRR